jgi:hypothetical protein
MFGLDPYWITNSLDPINKPGMYWGFTQSSCMVDITKAAR